MAIECEIGPCDFWDMTYKEIIDYIEGYNKRRKFELQYKASMDYKLADLICTGIAKLFDETVEYPSAQKAYPGIFDDLKIEDVPKQQDWRIAKERLMKYAEGHNRKRGEKD